MSTDLDTRLRKLEGRNRLQVAALVVGGILLLMTGAAGSRQPTTVRTERLEVVDSEGNILATLGTGAAGSTGLFIHDVEGRLRASLIHESTQTGLFIRDDTETVRIGAAQFSHGGGGFALHGPESKGAAVLYYKESGSLRFFDEEGNVVHRLPDKKP